MGKKFFGVVTGTSSEPFCAPLRVQVSCFDSRGNSPAALGRTWCGATHPGTRPERRRFNKTRIRPGNSTSHRAPDLRPEVPGAVVKLGPLRV